VAGQRGTDIGRMGNREPGVDVSGFVPAADARWVAVVGPQPIADAIADVAGRPWPDVVAAVRNAGGAAEVVNDVLDAADDPRLADRFEIVDHPVTGPARHVRSPFVVDGRATTTRRHAPLFDQHTDEVLEEHAGYDAAHLTALRDAKVIGGVLPAPFEIGL
jgi:crotonobetainyl-CoA:carnitine CoA-transferase CaiB-like acyl-CoA transferase